MDVRESAEFITKHAKYVHISESGVLNAANQIKAAIEAGKAPEFGDVSTLWRSSHVVPSMEEFGEQFLIDWIFLIDTLNFSFWTDDPSKPYTVSYKSQSYSGYAAMVAAVKRALEDGIPISSPAFYKDIEAETLKRILNPDNLHDVPMLQERIDNLRQSGTLLCSKYAGSFINVLKEANGSAQSLVRLLASLFPHYNDVCTYKFNEDDSGIPAIRVAFLKRAQIVVADIWACFGGKGIGKFDDIGTITMFADYRVPQILCAWGVLEYSSTLDLNNVPKGSREECDIRGCSIAGVEQIVDRLRSMEIDTDIAGDIGINAIRVDFFLWNYAKENSSLAQIKAVPVHHTRTVFY